MDNELHPTPPEQAPRTEADKGFRLDRLGSLLLRFLNRLKQTGKSIHTISAYRNDLSVFSRFLVVKGLDPELYSINLQEEWLHYLRQNGRKSAASLRRAQMSVRTFLHYLVTEKVIAGSPLLEAKSPRQPSHDLLVILPEHFRNLTTQLKKLALLGDEKATRDWALALVLGECGLKASEAASLTWGDVDFASQQPPRRTKPKGTLRVPGPGERIVSFGPDLALALSMLKSLRMSMHLDASPHAKLFFGYLNVSRKTRTPSLHRHGIKFVVYEVCQESLGIPYNSESLRNHAIVRWLDQGLATQKVAELAGYSSLHSLERFSTRARGLRKPKRRVKT